MYSRALPGTSKRQEEETKRVREDETLLRLTITRYAFQFDPSDRPLILQLAGNKAAPIIQLANDPMCVHSCLPLLLSFSSLLPLPYISPCSFLPSYPFPTSATSSPPSSYSNRFKGVIDGLDINCGCPQGFAMAKGIGAGILRTPDLLVAMVAEIGSTIVLGCFLPPSFSQPSLRFCLYPRPSLLPSSLLPQTFTKLVVSCLPSL